VAYCDLNDLKNAIPETELIRMTDDAGAGAIDESKTDEAIAAASALIDGHIGGRAALPLADVPPVLTRVAVDLAAWELYSRLDAGIPDHRKDRRDNAVKLLEQYAAGKITLGIQPVPNPPTSYASGIKTASRPKKFGTDTMGKY
jgi:phage gp36-like protein